MHVGVVRTDEKAQHRGREETNEANGKKVSHHDWNAHLSLQSHVSRKKLFELAANADGAIGGNPPINPFLQLNKRRLPLLSEQGWKDTVITYPGEVTRIAVRWAPTDMPATGAGAPVVGTNYYDDFPNGGFDPTILQEDPNNPGPLNANVGYVWHCHIIDHEDNEMMRNYTVGSAQQPIL